MSARDDVLGTMAFSAEWHGGGYDAAIAENTAELDAYRDEVLREAAERIRARAHQNHAAECVPCVMYDIAADLIDPEVTP